jgi:CRP/FNR family transcriptional regulator, cyclic AMP receptor protein
VTIHSLEEIIAQHPFFAGLAPAHVALIAGCARNVRYRPGEVVFREGESADRFFLVRAGRIGVDLQVPPRGALRVHTIEPGEILGWSWLFPPYRWSSSATALVATRALAMDGACLRGKLEDDPELGFDLMKRFASVMVRRLQSSRLQLLDIYGKTPDVG